MCLAPDFWVHVGSGGTNAVQWASPKVPTKLQTDPDGVACLVRMWAWFLNRLGLAAAEESSVFRGKSWTVNTVLTADRLVADQPLHCQMRTAPGQQGVNCKFGDAVERAADVW